MITGTNTTCNMPTQEPAIHDLLARLGELTKENRDLGYRIQDNLFGPKPANVDAPDSEIGCAKDAIEVSIKRLAETNDILRYVNERL